MIASSTYLPVPFRLYSDSMITAPPSKPADLEPDNGDDRNNRVLERVPPHDRSLAESLGPGGANVVVAKYLEHRRARQAHQHRCFAKRKHQRREEELLKVDPGILVERNVARAKLRRRPVEPNRTKEDQDNREIERWNRKNSTLTNRDNQSAGVAGRIAERTPTGIPKANAKMIVRTQQLDGYGKPSFELGS